MLRHSPKKRTNRIAWITKITECVSILITVIINLIKYAKFSIIDTRTQLLRIKIKHFCRMKANFDKQLSKIGPTVKGIGI